MENVMGITNPHSQKERRFPHSQRERERERVGDREGKMRVSKGVRERGGEIEKEMGRERVRGGEREREGGSRERERRIK
jgi:hypothetical protein